MAKPKRAPLYEVLSKSRNPPLWTQGREGDSDGQTGSSASPPASPPAPETPSAAIHAIRSPDEPPGSAPPQAGGTTETALRIDGRVIRIALDSTWAAAVLFAIVVLMGVAYGLGHGSGKEAGKVEAGKAPVNAEAGSLDEMDRVRQGPPQPDVTQGLGPSPLVPEEGPAAPTKVAPPSTTLTSRDDAAQRTPSGGWTAGLTYIVVQDFVWSAGEDALKAQEHLLQYSIETSIEQTPGKWYHLVATQGFNWDDPADRDRYERYLRRIQAIGQTYYKNGGRYRLEGYPKKLAQDHW
ncbi:MAG: hypothetical protein JXB13_13525 [Phycisphaerae bacterium]|nr:hypothetical protein [Phycisphaerae bacterium]